jgi:DNA-binding transcriptional ArsR family regulator
LSFGGSVAGVRLLSLESRPFCRRRFEGRFDAGVRASDLAGGAPRLIERRRRLDPRSSAESAALETFSLMPHPQQDFDLLDTFILLGEYQVMQLDDTLIALADDTRRSILKRLAAGEARVTEVAAPFGISLNSVSKHIKLLERAGLVRRRVSGRDHFLALEPRPFDELTRWMHETRAFWSSRLDHLEAALRADDAIAKASKTSSPKRKRK